MAWSFRAHVCSNSPLRRAVLSPRSAFYEPAALAQLGRELRHVQDEATLATAHYATLEIHADDGRASAAWVADPSNGAALLEEGVWQTLSALRCVHVPTVALLGQGGAGPVVGAPALLSPLSAAPPSTAVVAGVQPSGPAGPAAVVYPGTGYTLSRLHGPGMGLYLAMTAHAIPVQEAVAAGVLSHPLEALADISLVTEVLAATSEGRRFDHAVEVLDGLSDVGVLSELLAEGEEGGDAAEEPTSGGGFVPLRARVAETFGAAESVGELRERLREAAADAHLPSRWAQACLASLDAYPEWQSALTYGLIHAAADGTRCPDLPSCLALEANVAARMEALRRSRGGERGLEQLEVAAALELLEEAAAATGRGDGAEDDGCPAASALLAAARQPALPLFHHRPEAVAAAQEHREETAEDGGEEAPPPPSNAAVALRRGLRGQGRMNVRSQLLSHLEELLVAADAGALDVGPLGWECGALLQTEAGRRELQPMLVEAAQRGLLFPDPHGAVQKQRGPDTAINDVYRINLSVLQDALVAERKSAKSWGSGGVDRERRRRGRGGGDRPKQKRQKTAAEMQENLLRLRPEYVIQWLGELAGAVQAAR